MKHLISFSFALMFVFTISKAQTTAMQLSGPDCNGNNHDLFADLDAGKAVLLHFFMPNCGSCPPPAQKIQAMANHILATHPGMITAYAMPYNNATTCTYTANWVTTNNLSLYMPYDSGATQVAHYGGFGMPTVVLLGGAGSHRVMFSTLNFVTADTAIMRDSILALLGPSTGVTGQVMNSSGWNVFPNPASSQITVAFSHPATGELSLRMTDMQGKEVVKWDAIKSGSEFSRQFPVSGLPNGTYTLELRMNGMLQSRKVSVQH